MGLGLGTAGLGLGATGLGLGKGGFGGLGKGFGLGGFAKNTPAIVFKNPVDQLAAFSPIASLAASNPYAALSAGSHTLQIFNPAVNPRAALLSFDPGATLSLAVSPNPYGFGIW